MKIFIVPFRVRRMDDSIMPSGFSGAYVSCYSAASTYEEATEKALRSLIRDGMHPEEVLQPVHEMDSGDWCQHISEQWPEQANSLLSQIDFESAMKKGEVVYGPLGLYT